MCANSSHAFVKTVTALLTTQQSKLEHLVFLTKNGGCSAQLVRHASGNIDNSLGKLSYSWPNKAEEQQRKVRARKRTLNERNLQSTSTFLWRLQQHENLSPKSRLTCTDRKCQWSCCFSEGRVTFHVSSALFLPYLSNDKSFDCLRWHGERMSCLVLHDPPTGTLIQIIRLLFPQQWPWILEPKIAKITDMTYGVRKWEWHFYKLTRKLTEVNPEISRKYTKSRGRR